MTKLRSLIAQATQEARALHSANVEAEHLLLALSARPGSQAGSALAGQGLTYESIQAALVQEQHSSLRAAGIEPIAEERLVSTPRRRRPGWGASAKESLQRASLIGRKFKRRKMEELDLLLGVLSAELGTVPRALAIAGVDRAQLIRAVDSSR